MTMREMGKGISTALGLASLFVAGAAAGPPQNPAAGAPKVKTATTGTAVATKAAVTKSAVNPKVEALKKEAIADVDARREFTQQMVDQIFSYGELGFQEFETSKYITGILEKNGFTVQTGLSGIPTAWMATWGAGKPVIAIGSDIDGIPQASQKPGVGYHDPMIEGAPGHGEGHNSGQAVNITAVLAVKKIMEREHLAGTIKIWPGVAEELVGSKAWFIRDGYFKDVDIAIFSHVDSNFSPQEWGDDSGNGLVSIQYDFKGESAHAAGAPWRGRSALDAVELMDVGWNFRREHLRLQQRSHYVIPNGGDQPNVVPQNASVWYYFRENDYDHIKELWDIGNTMAKAASMMTNTEVTWKILGTAWPKHMSKTLSEHMEENIKAVGLPQWSDADQTLARGIQHELKTKEAGLAGKLAPLRGPIPEEQRRGGGSDDIGDISWNVPTVSLRFPSNIPGLPGHNWANAISMATPIAHKGATAGAKVQAMTMLDILLQPEVVSEAWDYFKNVQTKDRHYIPFITEKDPPATWLNKATLEKFRPEMKKYYYDPARYKTYLEQLGIRYPTVRGVSSTAGDKQ
jgi:aminobenzoyl-glutamate utilization protein B